MKNIIPIILLFVTTVSFAQQEVPFTLEDRDRLMRVEERLTSLEKQMNVRFESVNEKFESVNEKFESVNEKFEAQQRQIDDLKTMFTWGFSILITLMLFILGFIIWDRRTAVYPIKENLRYQTVEVEKIKAALKEMGESDQRIAEILKRVAIF
ncbi:MAG: hypothetical protein GVY19_01135 [Bacteroidetes bacterium]|nr:hypothetical protein [Bacteroidota bacterium]